MCAWRVEGVFELQQVRREGMAPAQGPVPLDHVGFLLVQQEASTDLRRSSVTHRRLRTQIERIRQRGPSEHERRLVEPRAHLRVPSRAQRPRLAPRRRSSQCSCHSPRRRSRGARQFAIARHALHAPPHRPYTVLHPHRSHPSHIRLASFLPRSPRSCSNTRSTRHCCRRTRARASSSSGSWTARRECRRRTTMRSWRRLTSLGSGIASLE